MLQRSGVIKADSVAGLPNATFRTFQLNDVLEEARVFVAEARAQAEHIIRESETRLEQAAARARMIEDEAGRKGDARGYREGYERGRAEGREVGRQEAFAAAAAEFAAQQASLVEACRSMLSAINAERDAWSTAARQDLIDLAMAIARRVAHQVGEEHRGVVLANLEEAVRLVGARTDVTIAVHPADAEAARAFARSLLDVREQWQKIRIVEEPEIRPGGCRVQWGTGSIDATLETQLDRIEAELNAGRAEAAGTRQATRAVTEEGNGTGLGATSPGNAST
jgi:flagellar assembly protein FliH